MSFGSLSVNSGGDYDESDDIKIDFGLDAAAAGGTHTYTVPPNYKWKILGVNGYRTQSEAINIYLSDGTNNHMLDANAAATTLEIHWNASQSITIPYGWAVNVQFTNGVAGALISSILYIETIDW